MKAIIIIAILMLSCIFLIFISENDSMREYNEFVSRCTKENGIPILVRKSIFKNSYNCVVLIEEDPVYKKETK